MPPRYSDQMDEGLKTILQDLDTKFEAFKAKHNADLAKAVKDAADAKAAAEALETELARASSIGRRTSRGHEGLPEEFMAFLRRGDEAPFRAALTVSSSPDGGILAPPQFAAAIDRLLRAENPFLELCNVVPIDGPAYIHPFALNNAVAGWRGEMQQQQETDAGDFGIAEIPRHEISAEPKISLRLIEDTSYDIGADLEQSIADAFAETTGSAFATGNGVNKPRGFLTYPTATTGDATRPIDTAQYFVTGVDGGFHATAPGDVFITAIHGLRRGYRSGASWLMNSATAGAVRKLKDLEGRYLWRDAMEDGQPDRLLGYPVTEWEAMPDIAADAFPVAFGNWRRAYAIPTGDYTVIRDGLTLKGFVKFFTRWRIGGGATNTRAYKLIKFGDT